jgi:tetratricopeptide (TPR) repeat protein
MAIAYMLGTALLREKRTTEAQHLLDRILSKGESAESALLLGFSLYQLHDNKVAAVQLARAIQLNPNLPTVHALYAQALKETGDTDGAAEQFRLELKQNPYDFVANIETSLILKQDGKLDEALACIQRALLIRPGDPGALYQQASVELLGGKVDVARAELESLVKDYPNFTEAHVSLATVYYRLKRKEDGDRERATVRRLQEEDQKAQAAKQSTPAQEPAKPQ